jgi:hypothetical protein
MLAVQNTMTPSQIPLAMALVFSNTIFTNSLKTLVPKYAPSVNPQVVINAGATGIRTMIEGAELVGVLVAYAKSVDRVFYLTAGAALGSFTFGWFMGFKDIRKKNQVSKA